MNLITQTYMKILIRIVLRYGVFDFEYTHQCQGTTEASKKEKLFLVSWCPDSAKIKKKMLYSSSFDALKKCLVGVQKYIQVSRDIDLLETIGRRLTLAPRRPTSPRPPTSVWRSSCGRWTASEQQLP